MTTPSAAQSGRRAGPRRHFLVLLMAVATMLLAWIVLPIAAALFAGVVLAVVLYPVQLALCRTLRGHNALAAGIVTLLATILIGGPMATVAALALREFAIAAVDVARDYDEHGLEGVVDRLPLWVGQRRAAPRIGWPGRTAPSP